MSADFLPFLLLFVPLITVIGGVIAGIVRVAGRQRVAELAYKERIAAIERGIDPSRLPAPPTGDMRDGQDDSRTLVRWLTIVGLVMVFGSSALAAAMIVTRTPGSMDWMGALVPMAIGLALLISAWIVRPRNGASHRSP